MKSKPLGKSTSEVEVTNISQNGFWVLFQSKELFVPFSEFPWFRNATVDSILKVELTHPGHLYWPTLDIDLAVESLEHPERFPLISKTP